jgi:hypothetical protein
MKFICLQIVWDEATKKWMNKDEDPAEVESFKPPPKMDDMMRTNQPMQSVPQYQQQQQQPMMNQVPMQAAQPVQQMQQQPQAMMNQVPMQNMTPHQSQQQPNAAAEQVVPPGPSAPNMFKMQKGRS